MSDLTDLTAHELTVGYRANEFSAVDVARSYRAAIESKNPTLNAYLEVFDDFEENAVRADKMRARGDGAGRPLLGVPIAVKDNILIKGKKCSAASKMLEQYVATYDATAIVKLRDAGAVFIGRTNMDEFAMGSSTEHSAFGPSRNPHDPERVPGGTSGGSAVAVAAKMVPVALGTDTGGSVRQPAALCGVIGFKPTYGAISRNGLIAMGSSLDQLGILAREVDDVQSIFELVRGVDKYDGTSLPAADNARFEKSIGVPRKFVKDAHPDVVEAFENTLNTFSSKGYDIVDIELNVAPHALAAYYVIMPAEVSTNLARFDGMRYGFHKDGKDLLGDYKLSRAAGFGAETKRRIILGTYILSHGYYDAYYRRAVSLRGALVREFDEIFKTVSFIATPTSPNPAFKIGEKQDPLSLYIEDIFTVSANLAGIPAISVPAGMIEHDGKMLPVGIQFMSPKQSEKALFAVAKEIVGR